MLIRLARVAPTAVTQSKSLNYSIL
jgi:hypothetical protein